MVRHTAFPTAAAPRSWCCLGICPQLPPQKQRKGRPQLSRKGREKTSSTFWFFCSFSLSLFSLFFSFFFFLSLNKSYSGNQWVKSNQQPVCAQQVLSHLLAWETAGITCQRPDKICYLTWALRSLGQVAALLRYSHLGEQCEIQPSACRTVKAHTSIPPDCRALRQHNRTQEVQFTTTGMEYFLPTIKSSVESHREEMHDLWSLVSSNSPN